MRSMMLLFCWFCAFHVGGMAHAQDIVPRPARLERGSGTFVLTGATRIVARGAALPEAALLRDYLRPATGFALPVGAADGAADAPGAIRLRLQGAPAGAGAGAGA